jgi:hypothetical protein
MVFPFVKSWHEFPSALGGHITKHNNSSAERRHFPFGGQALCFQDACVEFLKLFYCDALATRRISTGYKHLKLYCDTQRVQTGYQSKKNSLQQLLRQVKPLGGGIPK